MTFKQEIIAFVQEALGLSASISLEFSPLEGRGSDRTFSRVRWNRQGSAILIHYNPKRVENTCYAGISLFLREINVPAPRLIRHDPLSCLVLMEDLGGLDLWSLRGEPWKTRRALYEKTLAAVHLLHSFPEQDFPSDRVKLMEEFSPDLYRWERNYFREHFVRDVCGIKLEPSFDHELEAELSGLAERLVRTGRCLVHRDLQSQNVMVRDSEPYLIDFQGMRFGCSFYDLGSLLYDPYADLSDGEREELLSFYYALSTFHLDWDAFRDSFWEASAQRLMQALGAFGFLGLKKGLDAYLKHVPAGLRHLLKAASQIPSLPRLRELCEVCEAAGRREHP